VLTQIESYVNAFRSSQTVAATQVDVVAHSMGGLISRDLPLVPGFFASGTFGAGRIHKLITIGTPHRGTPVADEILKDTNQCTRALLFPFIPAFRSVTFPNGIPVSGSVGQLQEDLNQNVPLTRILNSNTRGYKIPTAMIAGRLTAGQLQELDTCVLCAANALENLCGTDPPPK